MTVYFIICARACFSNSDLVFSGYLFILASVVCFVLAYIS